MLGIMLNPNWLTGPWGPGAVGRPRRRRDAWRLLALLLAGVSLLAACSDDSDDLRDAGTLDAGTFLDASTLDATPDAMPDGGLPPRDAVRLSDAFAVVAESGPTRLLGAQWAPGDACGTGSPHEDMVVALWSPPSSYLEWCSAETDARTRITVEPAMTGDFLALLRLEVDCDTGAFRLPDDALVAAVDLSPYGALVAGGPHPELLADLDVWTEVGPAGEPGAVLVDLRVPLAASDPSDDTNVLLVRSTYREASGRPVLAMVATGLGSSEGLGSCAAACAVGDGFASAAAGPECWCNSVRFTEAGVLVVGSRAQVPGTVDSQPRTRVVSVDPTTGSLNQTNIPGLCFVAFDATTGAPVFNETCEDLYVPPPAPGDTPAPFEGSVARLLPLVETETNAAPKAVYLEALTDLAYDGPSGPGRVAAGDLVVLNQGPCPPDFPPVVSNPAPYCWSTLRYSPPTGPAVVVPIEERTGVVPHVLETSGDAARLDAGLRLRNLRTDEVSFELTVEGPRPECEIEPEAMVLELLHVTAAELGEVEPRLLVAAVGRDGSKYAVWVGEVPVGVSGTGELRLVVDGADGCPAAGEVYPLGFAHVRGRAGVRPPPIDSTLARVEGSGTGTDWEYRLVSTVPPPRRGRGGEAVCDERCPGSRSEAISLRGIEKKDIWRGMVRVHGSLDDLVEGHLGFLLPSGADLVDSEGASARERLVARWFTAGSFDGDIYAMNKAELIDAVASGRR